MDDFRRFFLRGLAALLPTLLTIALMAWAYTLIHDTVGTYITHTMLWICEGVSSRPADGLVETDHDPLRYGRPIDQWDDRGRRLTIEYKYIHHNALHSSDPEVRAEAETRRDEMIWRIAFAKYNLHLIGFLIAIILVYFTGFFLASFIGRNFWKALESLIYRLPVIKAVYPNIKQVTDFLLSDKPIEFSNVVAVQYPRKDCWSLGLATGGPIRRLAERVPRDLVTVFIPSSPTPVTGYVIQVPREDVIELNLSLDEALRFTISGGVIKPGATGAGDLPFDVAARAGDQQTPSAPSTDVEP